MPPVDDPVPGYPDLVPAPCSHGARPDGVDKGVLIVDDNEDMRLLFRLALEAGPGFDVWGEAANGAEALDRVADRCPDIVLLDLMMPVMDGVTALPILRERCPNTAVVVVSAIANAELRERLLAKGATAVCDKSSAADVMTMLGTL